MRTSCTKVNLRLAPSTEQIWWKYETGIFWLKVSLLG